MSLLVVGTLAFDSVKTPFGERDDVLGGSASFLATSASYFCTPRMVGVIGEDFPKAHLEFFRSRNIDTSGVMAMPGKTFRWRGRYDFNLNVAHTLETQLNVLLSFKPDLPPTYRACQYVALGNIDPELQQSVISQLDHPKLIACDSMNYWMDSARPQLLKTLGRVNLLCINDGEARQLSGEHNLVKAATAIRAMGPQTLVVKRGEHGVLLFVNDTIFAAPAYPLEEVLDPTGAGDSFAGGMLGYIARRDDMSLETLRCAVVMGSVMGSFAVEDFSLDRMRRLTQAEITKRFLSYESLTHFEAAAGAKLWA